MSESPDQLTIEQIEDGLEKTLQFHQELVSIRKQARRNGKDVDALDALDKLIEFCADTEKTAEELIKLYRG